MEPCPHVEFDETQDGHNACVSAIIELMQISNFKWNAPPASIKADVKAVLEKWAA
jgi:hypothetical protein